MLHRFMSAAAGVRAPMWRIVLLELTTAPIDVNSVVSSSELSPLVGLHLCSASVVHQSRQYVRQSLLGGLRFLSSHCSLFKSETL